MYVTGMGAVARNPGFKRGAVVIRMPLHIKRRGMGQAGCPAGQTLTNMYDGSQKCCGGPTPDSDPCSYQNVNAGYIATQQQAQANAIAGDAGNASALLAALSIYPQNVQLDAIRCQSNPGRTFVDDMGISVTCPSPSHSDVTTGGQPMSTYSVAQLAALIAAGATPSYESPVNVVGTAIPFTPPVVITAQKPGAAGNTGDGSTGGAQTKNSGGSGGSGGNAGGGGSGCVAPNTLVNGVCTAPAAPPASGTDLISQIETALSNSVTIAGMAIPIWALVGGGLAGLWFFGGKR